MRVQTLEGDNAGSNLNCADNLGVAGAGVIILSVPHILICKHGKHSSTYLIRLNNII